MMNEKVKKAYEELNDIRTILIYSDEIEEESISEWMDLLSNCVTPLLGEKQYAFFAGSLQRHVQSYHAKKVEKGFILEYVSKLIELIEANNKPVYSEEAKEIYEDAKSVCKDIASTVQVGFNTTKEVIKVEGPKYVAEAKNTLKGLGKKFKKWLDEDDEEDDAADEDE